MWATIFPFPSSPKNPPTIIVQLIVLSSRMERYMLINVTMWYRENGHPV